jgi:hypothetical protein
MSKSVSIEQSHAVIQALVNNVDWNVLDGDALQQQIINKPKEAGAQFTTFLKNGVHVIIGEPKVISIDRSQLFNPAEFIGKGWTIEGQDERSLALIEIDLTKVKFETCLQKGEISIQGEKKLKRLKQMGNIRLDAGVFMTLWQNQNLIPERWKEKTNGNTTFIYFDGTILLNPDDDRYVLSLFWGGGQWYWYYYWLGHDWDANDPSAVLAS